jgi:hypothetical protein
MERETGIEPVTSSLGSWRSTSELLPLRCKTYYLAFPCSLYAPFGVSIQSTKSGLCPMVGPENGQ